MDVTHQEERRCFVLQDKYGEEQGRIDYKVGTKGRVFAVHTEVQPPYRGKGLATLLLDALAGWAQETGQTVVPICAFSKKMFETYPEHYAHIAAPPL